MFVYNFSFFKNLVVVGKRLISDTSKQNLRIGFERSRHYSKNCPQVFLSMEYIFVQRLKFIILILR